MLLLLSSLTCKSASTVLVLPVFYAFNVRWQITRPLSIISREVPGREPKWADYQNRVLDSNKIKKGVCYNFQHIGEKIEKSRV